MRVRPARALLLVALAGPLILAPHRAGAQSLERIDAYDVAVRIERSGALRIRETIAYDFGSNRRHGIFRDLPERLQYDDARDHVYPIDVLSVRGSAGTPTGYEIEHEGGTLRIRIGDADRTISGRHTYVIDYRVEGAMNGFPDHDELYWNAIGAQWEVPIERARVGVTAPAPISGVACFAGLSGSTGGCERSTVDGASAAFAQRDLAPYQALTVVVALPKGAVSTPAPILEERWSLPRAFSLTPLTGGLFAFLLVLGLGTFAWLAWTTGRDRRYAAGQIDVLMGAPEGTPEQAVPLFERGGAPVEFAPPEDLRPGQVGTLVD